MLSKSLTLTLLASAGIADAANIRRHIELHERATATSNSDSSLTLNANAIASGSFSDGLSEIGSEKFEAPSATSQNNFMNFCSGQTLTNGLQITTGSCNGIPMGQLPAKDKMMSSIITFPLAGSATIQSDTTFNITVQMSNIVAGSFTNADSTYFAAPQALQGGVVVGHTHVTVQDMGKSLNPTTALDPTQFAFFKGINDAGNGKGLLSATVTGGLPAGNYRVCTMASASNHQPAIMPVAQRGTADDCTKFTVVGSGTTANDASNNGSKGQAAAALAASAVAAGPDNTNPASSAVASATSSSIAGNNGAQASGKAGSKSSSSSVATTAAAQATGKGGAGAGANSKSSSAVTSSASATVSKAAVQSSSAAPAASSPAASSSSGALGGLPALPITKSNDPARPFEVNGNTFVNEAAALQRSCDIQFNACADAFNRGAAQGFNLSDCSAQQTTCLSGSG
ncbi:ribosomal s17 protein [Rutstroemia sp. NJR-2017a WRK4]|nr:ribosomal s17 protein [Rutstroemia sp. NJR-2017a WRK4]